MAFSLLAGSRTKAASITSRSTSLSAAAAREAMLATVLIQACTRSWLARLLAWRREKAVKKRAKRERQKARKQPPQGEGSFVALDEGEGAECAAAVGPSAHPQAA